MCDKAIHLFNEQNICKICSLPFEYADLIECYQLCEHDKLPPCTDCTKQELFDMTTMENNEYYGNMNDDLCEWCGYDLNTLLDNELCCLKQGLLPHDRPKGDS